MEVKPRRYDEFIDFCFTRFETSPDPETERPIDFESSHDEIVELFTVTMLRSGTDLTRFSDSSIGHGISVLFCEGSNVADSFLGERASAPAVVPAILSIGTFYRACLDRRNLSEYLRDTVPRNVLGSAVFMLWDLTSLARLTWTGPPAVGDAVMSVLRDTLYLSTAGCVQSGLHGLGHQWEFCREAEAVAIIDGFLADRPNLPPGIRDYAMEARKGSVL